MKKLCSALCLVLLFTLLLSPASLAAGSNTDTLAHWDIKIAVPDGATAVLEGSSYYIYADEEGYIPYVMLTAYKRGSARSFLDEFTDYMRTQYGDLRVTLTPAPVIVGDKVGYEIDYSYSISGYTASDRRIAVAENGWVYLFCAKEVPELGLTVGDMLEQVVADCVFLSGGTEPDAGPELADAYLYCVQGGMPKYWLDLSGQASDDAILHCWFRSSDPTFYERTYTLDLASAERTADGFVFHKITDDFGFDRSDWFKELSFRMEDGYLVLEVVRDERTLAGGSEDNVLTGEYWMEPMGVVCVDPADKVYQEGELPKLALRPLEDGPYTAEELGQLARVCYFTGTGFYAPHAEAVEKADGSFMIHLFEIVDTDGVLHTATSAWYTVDAFGEGVNDITGEPVSLIPAPPA